MVYNFKVEPDFKITKSRSLSEIGFIKNGLKYLAPNQKIKFFLTNMIENFEERSCQDKHPQIIESHKALQLYKTKELPNGN